MERVDVAVVGGGPAGTSAGWAAARQDADVVVLEKGVPREDREEKGPDSTDAAGMLNYWIDLMDLPVAISEEVILQELDGATFEGPTETVTMRDTGMESSYSGFGFTFHRARFDDWLRGHCEDAGADYRVGISVRDVDIDARNGHTVTLRDGHEIEAEYLILADGPQRTVTRGVLSEFVPEKRLDNLASTRANHIAYQEYREFPPELFEDDLIKFWWGAIPGHTAYPWVFPNDGTVARVGLTMPIGVDLSTVRNRDAYTLLHSDDTTVPSGEEYIRRLLEAEYPEYDYETDFPLVEDRGKRNGVESYPISSTRPIDSPVGAKVAVAGGAMGTTSAFHEGGDHVAVRTGKIAGSLAGAGSLSAYNREWKRAVGTEIQRNVAMADVVRGFEPDDWDRTFRSVGKMLDDGYYNQFRAPLSGFNGLSMLARYQRAKFGYRNNRYVQIRESEYAV
jgi:flavin-dependent dehydrogenase